jgi:hypothetical protein
MYFFPISWILKIHMFIFINNVMENDEFHTLYSCDVLFEVRTEFLNII